MTVRKKVAIETDVAQGMHYIDPASGSVVPPIMPSTTFARDENYALMSAGNAYSRDDNPSFRTAEAMLTRLEGGADSMLFSSGMSAAAAV
ncbi:MAG: cystathionine gamma-synthase, partial [Woeseia sp.]|nr:cystathionine gamma-synthase [Woeseia sp.]